MALKLYILERQGKRQQFDLEYRKTYTIGRASDNDIQIDDQNVSRYHIKIQSKFGNYYITDLKSKSGTLLNGKLIDPGIEIELEEGMTVVIGMTVIVLGDASIICLQSFLDSICISSETCDNNETLTLNRTKSVRRNLEFVYKVNNILMDSTDSYKISEEILDNILDLFVRIDRCAIIFSNGKNGNISEVVSRTRKIANDFETIYCQKMVEKSILLNKEIVIYDSYEEKEEDDEIISTLKSMKIRSVFCIPLFNGYKTIGTIYADSLRGPFGFRRGDTALLKDTSSRIALTIDHLQICESLNDKPIKRLC